MRWRGRAARRRILFDLVHTREGRLALAVCAVALPSVASLVAGGGNPGSASLPPEGAPAVWMLGVLSSWLCLSFLVPSVLARALVLESDSDPLRAHPAALGPAGGVTGALVSLGASGYVLAFTLLFHGAFLASSTHSPLAFVAASALAFGTMTLVASVVSDVTLRLLRGEHPRERAQSLRRWCVLPFFGSFVCLATVPILLGRHLATRPVGPEVLLNPGTPGEALLWTCLGLALVVLAPWSLLVRWQRKSPAELALVGSGGWRADRRACPPRIPLSRPDGTFSRSLLLLAKDHIESGRTPTIAWLCVASAVGLGLSLTGREVTAGVAVPALLAIPTLSWVGREGRNLDGLMLGLGPLRLLASRFVASTTWVAAGGLLSLATVSIGTISIRRDLAAFGMATGFAAGTPAFVALAVSLGALLPDPRRRSLLLPGASRSAMLAYALGAATIIGAGVSSAMRAHRLLGVLALPSVAIIGGALLGLGALVRRTAEWRP